LANIDGLKNAVVASLDGTGLLGELVLKVPVSDEIAIHAVRGSVSDEGGGNSENAHFRQ